MILIYDDESLQSDIFRLFVSLESGNEVVISA